MEMVNYTPFMPMCFPSLNPAGNEFSVLILKGTFEIQDQRPLELSPEQAPLTFADEFYGDPGYSSVKFESDLATFKPKADIYLTEGIARPPADKPATTWQVTLSVGGHVHRLRVTGPRAWVYEKKGWRLTDPQACMEVPLKYELAYGGFWKHEDESGVCFQNPFGLGCKSLKYLDESIDVPAPQIEFLDDPIRELGREYRVGGFGPIHRSWQPRLKLAGDFDDRWKEEKWPLLPNNFNPLHNNASHEELIQKGYFQGGELIELRGFTPESSLQFYLPRNDVFVFVRYVDGAMAVHPFVLDTVVLNIEKRKCFLTWRYLLPLEPFVRVAEARMIAAKEKIVA